MKKCVALVIILMLIVSLAVPSFATEETPNPVNVDSDPVDGGRVPSDDPYHISEDVDPIILVPLPSPMDISIEDPTIDKPLPSPIDFPIEEPIIGVPRPVEEDLEELDVARWILRPIWDYIRGFKLNPMSISEFRSPLINKSVRLHRWSADKLS